MIIFFLGIDTRPIGEWHNKSKDFFFSNVDEITDAQCSLQAVFGVQEDDF